MTTVFTKTANSSATQSFVGAAVASVVGGIFIAVPVIVSGMPTVATIVLPIIGVLCLVWAVVLGRSGAAYLTSDQDWRVEVSERMLSWQSPIQTVMTSFDVPLTNIKTLQHIRTRRTGKNIGYRNDFTIELIEGDPIKISENIPGIDPILVFEALETQGVSINRETHHRHTRRHQ